MQTISFVMGATASGKTYFIQQHYAGKDIDVLNIYDYQQKAYDEAGFGEKIPFGAAQFRCLKKAQDMHLRAIVEKLRQGRDVVAEQTFYKAKRRITYIDEIRKAANAEIEVYVMCPSDLRWQENIRERKLAGRFEAFKRDFVEIEFPNPAEGFDRIYEVADGNIRLRMDRPKKEITEQARKELAEEGKRIQEEEEERKKRKELIESMNTRSFWHYCEVCGKREFITAQDAFDRGWDYPPRIGHFGLLGPRTCGSCGITDTLYWKINAPGRLPVVLKEELTPEELITWERIKKEPKSLLNEGED